MPASGKVLTVPALLFLLVLPGCDEGPEQQTREQDISVDIPENYYASPPPAPAAPPPVPGFLIVPESFDMGDAVLEGDMVSRKLTISAGGETAAKIFGIERSGSEEISFSTDCPGELLPGESCTLMLDFLPQVAGDRNARILLSTGSELVTIAITATARPPRQAAAPPPPTELPVIPVPSPYDSPVYQRSLALLRARRGRPPQILSPDSDRISVTRPEYRMSDEDYLREGTPSMETGFPVDRSGILTITRMHWGVLDREIQSSLPGLVIVRVDEDVYGTDGLVRILEKGDAYVGRYQPLERVGDDRLDICFFRIIRLADGAHVYNGDECFAYATDAMGRVGLVGEVDNRLWEKYGSAFVTAGISALASFGTSQFDDGNGDVENASEALSDQLGKITATMIEKNIDLAPIITIAGGERVGIQLLRDLYIRRPEPLKE